MMRWTEGGDDSPAARRAADLLRKLPTPAPLTPRQLSDLEARLQQPAPRRARLLPWTLALGATAAVATAIIILALRTPPSRRGATQRTIVLPQCGDVGLELRDHAVTLTGPGSATVEPDHIILSAGRLHIAASPRSLTITAPDAQITVPPGSAADIRVHDARTIVAALAGQLAVQWTATRTLAQLPAGASLSDSGPATLPPAHCEAAPAPSSSPSPPSPPPSASSSPAPSPAGVGPSPAVVPEPVPSPTLAAPARRTPVPVPGPVPAPAPALAAPPSPSPAPAASAAASESALGAEARLLSAALLRLRAHDAAGALSILDDYDARFPRGQLAVEASRLRAAVRSLPAASPRDE